MHDGDSKDLLQRLIRMILELFSDKGIEFFLSSLPESQNHVQTNMDGLGLPGL
jgi:hypothetical protein